MFNNLNRVLQVPGVRAVQHGGVDVAGRQLHKRVPASSRVRCAVSVDNVQSALCTSRAKQFHSRLFTHVCRVFIH